MTDQTLPFEAPGDPLGFELPAGQVRPGDRIAGFPRFVVGDIVRTGDVVEMFPRSVVKPSEINRRMSIIKTERENVRVIERGVRP